MFTEFSIRINGPIMITEFGKWLIGRTILFYHGSYM
jgi:hypothetical protein